MNLLSVDAGTTHCKAALFDDKGGLLALASRPTRQHKTGGYPRYDPHELWSAIVAAIGDVTGRGTPQEIGAIGLSSMAETGLLLDRKRGSPRTPFLPWFDTSTVPQAEQLARSTDVPARFRRTGMRPTFKCAIARLLWLREKDPSLLQNAVWLSVADYLAYRLSGALATDFSLASRTYAFELHARRWDAGWLAQLQLDASLFPALVPAGDVVGLVSNEVAETLRVAPGTPVTIAGHDHVCASLAGGAIQPGVVFDSMGTAETLVGALAARELDEDDYRSGFTFGHHLARDTTYWMGGLSTSGGSVEWLRGILGEPPLSYDELHELLQELPAQPTGIVYFPYLAGSGSPHSDERMRAVFAGLRQEHGRAHLAKAVLEGTAFEMEWIRRAAGRLQGVDTGRTIAGGGGTRNRHWLQIKANVSGRPLAVMPVKEATLLGAALVAGIAASIFADAEQALGHVLQQADDVIVPDPWQHSAYRRLFEEVYTQLQKPLRQTSAALAGL